jgi:hypothetical protein
MSVSKHVDQGAKLHFWAQSVARRLLRWCAIEVSQDVAARHMDERRSRLCKPGVCYSTSALGKRPSPPDGSCGTNKSPGSGDIYYVLRDGHSESQYILYSKLKVEESQVK